MQKILLTGMEQQQAATAAALSKSPPHTSTEEAARVDLEKVVPVSTPVPVNHQ